jgi:hypothetical protein
MSVRTSAMWTVTREGFGLLQQVREIGAVHFPDFDYNHVDRMLARCRLILEIGLGDHVGPVIDYGQIIFYRDEFVGLMLVGSQMGFQGHLPPDFNRRLWVYIVTELGLAIDYH